MYVSLCFLYSGYSDVFVTSSKNDIRVWNTNTSKELLRITVPNMDCHAVAVTVDGKSIVSGRSMTILPPFSVKSRLGWVLILVNLLLRDDPYCTCRKNSLKLIELSSINKVCLI